MFKKLKAQSKPLALVFTFALLISGCSSNEGTAERIRDFPEEPSIGWSYVLNSDSAELLQVFDWSALSAVLVLSYEPSDTEDFEVILDLVAIETGEIIDSSPLSRMADIGEKAPTYFSGSYFNSVETEDGGLLMEFETEERSHVLRFTQDGLDSWEEISSEIGFYGLASYEEVGQNLVFLSEDNTFVVYDSNLNEINSIELQEGDRIRHVDAEGLLISNLGDEKETYRLVPLLAEEESPAVQFDLTLDADIGSGFDYLGQVEDLYVFGLNKLDQWEIFTVSKEGEILETVVVNPASPDAYFVQFVNIEEDRIYVLQEFREAYFMTVLDSSLNEIAEIPIERVEEVTFGIAVGSDSFGKLVILDDYSRFAFVDMQTNQISRFRSLSEDEFWFYFIGLGFSQQAFLIEDGDELISYDLDLGLNWSFDVLDDERVIRAGPNIFLHREDDGELFILQSD